MIVKKFASVDKFLDKVFFRYFIYFFFVVLFFGIFLRITYLDYDSMWIDETISAISAKSILETGSPVLGSQEPYSRAELFHYAMAFFIYIFGGDFGARFISVIFGVLTIWLSYVFAKKFIDEPFSNIMFPLMISVLSIEVIYSKQARFYQALQFFYFLSVYLFYSFVYSKYKDNYRRSILYFLALILSTYMTIHLHSMGIILLPLYGAAYLILKFRFKDLGKLKYFALYFSLIVMAFLASLIILMRYDSLILPDESARAILYSNLYVNFLYSWLPILVLSIIGLLVALKDNFKRYFSLSLFAIIPLIGLFVVKFFATRYAYFSIFLIMFYLVYLLQRLHLKYFILVFILVLFSGTMFTFSPIKEPRLDFSMPIADYKGAFSYIESNDFLSDKKVATTWPPAAMWYGDGADYWLNYSLSGTNDFKQIKNGVEVYSGAQVIYSFEDFEGDFVLVLDGQGKSKLMTDMLRSIETHCVEIKSGFNIEVFYCNYG